MRQLISPRFSAIGLLIIFFLVIVFHLLVLLGVIPFTMVWGGRLENESEMIRFESVSIIVNLMFILIVAIYLRLVKLPVSKKILVVCFWLMFVLFFFNTVGNLFSNNELEKLIFTPLTLLLSIFSLRLAIE